MESASALLCFTRNDSTLYPDMLSSCELVTAVQEVADNQTYFTITPNPVPSSGTVECSGIPEDNMMVIFDMTGKERMKVNGVKDGMKINLAGLPEGMYLYRICSDDQVVYKGKIIRAER